MITKMLTATLSWVDARFPLTKMWKEHLSEYYAPKNFNFWYYFGSLALMILVIQIATGVFLTMGYESSAAGAADSVSGNIMYDMNWGWLIRYMHSTGASAFFIVVYLHMFRGMIYGSYKKPRELIWVLGVFIYLALMAEAFMGYLLPWGQMSLWGAKVIINLFDAIPLIGPALAEWVRGDFDISDITLKRFVAFHVIAVPLILIMLVAGHILALHEVGSNNPDGVEIKKNKDANGIPLDGIPFHPYYSVKDIVGVVVFLMFFFGVVFFNPEMGGYFLEHDNYVPADSLVTPEHIKPLWYFTPFYSILRAIPPMYGSAFPGVVAMGAAVVVLFFLPWIDRHPVKSIRYRELLFKINLYMFVAAFMVLGWLGTEGVTLLYSELAFRFSEVYFGFFIVLGIYSSERTNKYYLTWLVGLVVLLIVLDYLRTTVVNIDYVISNFYIPVIFLAVTLGLPMFTNWNKAKAVPERVTDK